MDLNKMVMDSLTKMEKEGKLQEVINAQVAKTVTSIVEDSFGRFSDFSKDLKQVVKEELKINTRALNLQSYNHVILEELRDTLDNTIKTHGSSQIKEAVENLLIDAKREYKLSELVKELKGKVDGSLLEDLEDEEYHEMTLHVESSYSSTVVYMDPDDDVSEYNCRYRLFITDEGRLFSVRIKDEHKKDVLSLGEGNNSNKDILAGVYGLDDTLFKIYTSGAKLIVDEDYCDTHVYNSEE